MTPRRIFDTAVNRTLFGLEVPVADRGDLIAYKTWLSAPGDEQEPGEHQERDVRGIGG